MNKVLLLCLLLLSIIGVPGVLLSVFIDWKATWNAADVIAFVLTFALFWIGYFLGRRQSEILEELSALQGGLAEYRIREKMGCIESHAGVIERAIDSKDAAEVRNRGPLIVQDSLSVLPLYKFATERLQIEYRNVVRRALYALSRSDHEQFSILLGGIMERTKRLEIDGSHIPAAYLYSAVGEFQNSPQINIKADK